jgi:Rrf2 family nitric oxide-sensitive transcriptional repressor
MCLTAFFDHALRVLMYAEAHRDRLVTVGETCSHYDASPGLVTKVVNALVRAGYLRSARGRYGGFTLARPPHEINLGAVMRATKPDFALVECFAARNHCPITDRCHVPGVLNRALNAFVSTLDGCTLADIVLHKDDLRPSLPVAGRTRGPHFTSDKL